VEEVTLRYHWQKIIFFENFDLSRTRDYLKLCPGLYMEAEFWAGGVKQELAPVPDGVSGSGQCQGRSTPSRDVSPEAKK
jgi:hypothetical protein